MFCGFGLYLVKVNINVPVSADNVFQIVDVESGMTEWLGREATVLRFHFQ